MRSTFIEAARRRCRSVTNRAVGVAVARTSTIATATTGGMERLANRGGLLKLSYKSKKKLL